jgi:hypothetical protein
MDETLLERIFRALHREKVRYAVFGGVALNLHGIVRTTEDLESMEMEFKGVPVPVVTPRMLHRMKRDAVRPRDRGDVEELRRGFGFGEKD